MYGEESRLPFYYRKLPGNIPDVKTVRNLIADITQLEYKKVKLVMDRGFYSEDNVNAMLGAHLKFLLGVKVSLLFVQEGLTTVRDDMRNFDHYNPEHDLFSYSKTITWEYKQGRPYKGDTLEEERRMYLHLYFSAEKALEDERTLNSHLIAWKTELETGKTNVANEKSYSKYFDVKATAVRGVKVTVKQKAIEQAKKNHGFFAMISNHIKDPITALERYRNKDLIEKAFDNLKERLSFSRALVSSEKSLDGKLFVEFIALIIMSDIKRRMRDSSLLKKYTMQEMLDHIDLIECFEQKGRHFRFGEIIKKHSDIFHALAILPPT
jgi:transposase